MLKSLRYRWRFFWSRRSRGRIALAVILVLLAALSTGYLLLPGDYRAPLDAALATFTQAIGSLQEPQVLGGGAALLLLLSLGLIFAPSYRHHSYLANTPSLIPPVSVYVDAENQLRSEDAIAAFKRFLMEHLDGRRADLLYFLDASTQAQSAQYKSLYRFGFRPIDVPHNQTGDGKVKEAVDREIAMHAYERALLGPKAQEFILISHDGDFVPLVYRLAALGHRVQVWATPMPDRYRALETYLDVTVLDLSRVLSERKIASSSARVEPPAAATANRKKKKKRKRTSLAQPLPLPGYTASEIPPALLALEEERLLQRAIEDMLTIHVSVSGKSFASAQDRSNSFRDRLRVHVGPALASVGYSGGDRLDYWIEHMMAISIFHVDDVRGFPQRGPARPEEAAVRMLSMAQAVSAALRALTPSAGERLVTMQEFAAALASGAHEADAQLAAPLFLLIAPDRANYTMHARYFAWCARALNLAEFDDVEHDANLIRLAPAPAIPLAAPTSATASREPRAESLAEPLPDTLSQPPADAPPA